MSQASITSWFKSAVSPSTTTTAVSQQPLRTSQKATPAPPPPPQSKYASPLSSSTIPSTSISPYSSRPASPPAAPLNIHPNAVLRPITAADIPAVRRVLSLMLAVYYADSFFKPISTGAHASRHSRVITWTDPVSPARPPTIVGVIVCRVESRPGHDGPESALYLQALCLLSPYRGLGLMTMALDAVTRAATTDGVKVVDAHVWTASEDALAWYARRGFRRSDTPIEGYYQKLDPASAWVVSREAVSTTEEKKDMSCASSIAGPLAAAAVKLMPFDASPATASSVTSLSSVSAAADETKSEFGPPHAAVSPSPASQVPPPPGPPRGMSFQNAAPPTSWNDLPEDMAVGSVKATTQTKTTAGSRKKRDRSYPVPTY
ncbi:N-alpha-acetyltransferase 50 [Ceratocystis lukuohia]|uniref:N-alpha-acetyltransferase 50 n=1 Tax=Ceratocystis lukuohia TaxID=2019550 RepID=A0ABR4MF25_9PEZI